MTTKTKAKTKRAKKELDAETIAFRKARHLEYCRKAREKRSAERERAKQERQADPDPATCGPIKLRLCDRWNDKKELLRAWTFEMAKACDIQDASAVWRLYEGRDKVMADQSDREMAAEHLGPAARRYIVQVVRVMGRNRSRQRKAS